MSCDDVDVIHLEPSKVSRVAQTALRRLVYHDISRKLVSLNPGLRPVRLTKDYELFLVHCNFLEDVWYANAIHGWRDHCKTSICWIDELWSNSVPHLEYWLPILSRFDYVIVGFPGSGKVLGDAIGRPCQEIDAAVDAIRFSPFPGPPGRVIDVYSVGRTARLGYPSQKGRRLYHFRIRHGFNDRTDEVFDRLWSGDGLTWRDIEAACAETATSLQIVS